LHGQAATRAVVRGFGTRLWPLSREAYPKQFLPLVGDDSMLQATWRRVAPIWPGGARSWWPIEEHRFMAAEQLREMGAEPSAILLEPVGRNTAPAIAVAALQAMRMVRMRCCWCCPRIM
jgi:mannose-1-phosphate guanylyltransferase/mannose-6-phosphate isomerase